MNLNKTLEQARTMASKAKDGSLKLNGDLYTFEFVSSEWVYQVYKNGIELVRFNCKSLPIAKKYLKEWLSN